MSRNQQIPPKIQTLIKSFKSALRKFFGTYQHRKPSKDNDSFAFYQEAKKAQTQERNLIKALELYVKAIENREKKDSSIKDFASSLHQLGYTKAAVKFMDDCEVFYDGNKEKYFRLRDNLQIQIRPTGKHLCKYLLIQNVDDQIKRMSSEDDIKNSFFKSPKRIKKIKFLQDFQLLNPAECEKTDSMNILLQFQSFSAAKKTLQSFYFDEWFGSYIYWVNSGSMRIICAAEDGKKDFEQGFVINEELINYYLLNEKEDFWVTFGERIYFSRESNGFINLLSTHLIKQSFIDDGDERENKENIFESSKIADEAHEIAYKRKPWETWIQPIKDSLNNRYLNTYEENFRGGKRYQYQPYSDYQYQL